MFIQYLCVIFVANLDQFMVIYLHMATVTMIVVACCHIVN